MVKSISWRYISYDTIKKEIVYYKNLIFTRSDFLDTLVRFGIIKSEKLTTYPLSGIYRNR